MSLTNKIPTSIVMKIITHLIRSNRKTTVITMVKINKIIAVLLCYPFLFFTLKLLKVVKK